MFAAPATLAFASFSMPLSAQTRDEKAAADALFDAARKMMEAGDYDHACPKFQDSHDIDPAVGTLLNLGLCFTKAGKTASAWSTYREAASLAQQLGQGEREQHARQEIATLEASLVRFIIEVSPEVQVISGLTITREGQEVPQSMWGEAIPVDPGEIAVEVTAPGYVPTQAQVSAAGAGATITFKVPPLKRQDEAVTPSPAQQPSDSANSGSKIGPLVLGGVGIAAAGVGTYFAFSSKKHNDEALGMCQGDVCSSQSELEEHDELVDDARRDAIIAYVGWGVGAAALGGAVVWLLAGSPKGESATTFEPLIARHAWGLSARGSF